MSRIKVGQQFVTQNIKTKKPAYIEIIGMKEGFLSFKVINEPFVRDMALYSQIKLAIINHDWFSLNG